MELQFSQYQHQSTPVPSTDKVCSALKYRLRNIDPLGRRHEYTGGFPHEVSPTHTWFMLVDSCLQCRGASAIWFVNHWWRLTSATLISVWPCYTPGPWSTSTASDASIPQIISNADDCCRSLCRQFRGVGRALMTSTGYCIDDDTGVKCSRISDPPPLVSGIRCLCIGSRHLSWEIC